MPAKRSVSAPSNASATIDPTPIGPAASAIHLSPQTLKLVADFFKVLSEGSRLQIICALKSGSKNVTEIIAATGLGQANVSKHLKVLAQAGVVSREQQGVSVYYQISNPFIFDLCELVCNSLVVQFQQQTQHLGELAAFRDPNA
ncbi:ArsR/SmtB family transcription factor [Prochlorothrix hollandica]|uniref:ArsR/SmtB family transcription factor n=1 Tax=Prochlorothrix hollandica TaxID=1223 RepID=UPI000349D045|nr:metalloregulator ArsR/SmtB family transcription factor [Prochlorothrix hollandica]